MQFQYPTVVIHRLASVAAIIGGAYFAWTWYQTLKVAKADVLVGDSTTIQSDAAARLIPSAVATDPGFSNYARRSDLDAALDIADQPLGYGQVNPI